MKVVRHWVKRVKMMTSTVRCMSSIVNTKLENIICVQMSRTNEG
jgi:hypothetical protein